MKKFYSLVLMAAALLVGTNVWAANTVRLVNHTHSAKSGDYASLQAAVNAVEAGDTATITLLADQKLTAPVVIPLVGDTANWNGADTEAAIGDKPIRVRAGQKICLDLNGFDVEDVETGSAIGIFHIAKGTLHITGTGNVKHNHAGGSDNPDKSVITLWGAPWAYKNTIWSKLYIDENVIVNSNGNGKNYGICINNTDATGTAAPANIRTKMGYITYYGTNPKDNNITACQSTGTAGCAYGVQVFIKGKVFGNHRGINVLGTINAAPVCDEGWGDDASEKGRRYKDVTVSDNSFYYNNYYPYVKIYKDAEVWCKDNGLASGNGGIYGGGYAVYDISGNVHGQTGIFLKSGDLVLTDATVASDSQDAQVNGDYGKNVSGTGIFIASDKSYVGDVEVLIEGTTTVTGGGEAAIVDALATTATETHVSSITITGGTIEPGTNGGIELTNQTGTEKTVITGGNFEGEIVVGGQVTPVDSLIPETHHVTYIEDEDGNKVIAVSEGAAPTAGNKISDQAENASVKWVGDACVKDTIKTNLKLNELEINDTLANGDARTQQLVIKAGVTLEAKRVILGSAAQVIVEPGAKFIVSGKDGIVSLVESNIVLKTSETAQAWFLIEPTVMNNRYPMATVELISKGYKKANGTYVWQRFGVPSYTNGETRADVKYDHTGAPTAFYKFDYANDSWASMANTDKFLPFQCYELTTTATVPGTIYSFECPLMGNGNGTLTLAAKWNYYANSYTAPIDIREMVSDVVVNYGHISGTVYLYRASDNWWYDINLASLDDGDVPTQVNPMQAFIFQRMSEGNNPVVNYKDQIWTPIMGSGAAPAPARNRNTLNKAIVEITAADGTKDFVRLVEGDQFSAEFDNGYDAAKFMNDASFQIYANMENEKMSTLATDNLEGTELNITAENQTSFTMTFRNVNGLNYAVRDNLTGTETEIAEGATYMFSVSENTNATGRFQIVEANKMPTAIDNIEETAAKKGIYTITGQFVGNDYHSLPNGIYVVDGKKIVK